MIRETNNVRIYKNGNISGSHKVKEVVIQEIRVTNLLP